MNVPQTPNPPPGLWANLPPATRQRLLALLSQWTLRRWAPPAPPVPSGGRPDERAAR
jgi:hypothetical protein